MARLAGFEPTISASAGLRSIQLSYKRTLFLFMVPKERFELSRPYGHYALNVARLPFRHFGMTNIITLYDTYFFVNRITGQVLFRRTGKLTGTRYRFRIE